MAEAVEEMVVAREVADEEVLVAPVETVPVEVEEETRLPAVETALEEAEGEIRLPAAETEAGIKAVVVTEAGIRAGVVTEVDPKAAEEEVAPALQVEVAASKWRFEARHPAAGRVESTCKTSTFGAH